MILKTLLFQLHTKFQLDRPSNSLDKEIGIFRGFNIHTKHLSGHLPQPFRKRMM